VHRLRNAIAQALELEPHAVVVEHMENAGCYGHNASDDAAFDAVLLARAVPGSPVQARWTRRDELTWAPFGSAMAAEVSAQLAEDGGIASWTYDVWSQGHTARPGYQGVPGLLAAASLAKPHLAPPAADPGEAAGGGGTRNAVPIYDVGVRCVRGHRVLDGAIRSSALRALGAHLNVFAIESFVDELAVLAGVDPVEYRLRHLSDQRARAVLTTAAEAAGWGRTLPEGTGLGVGLARYKGRGAYCAVVADVEAETDVRVRRLTVAVDVGRVINPDGVRFQLEGGAIQATSWTTKERVRFDRRRITSEDWESYPILRFSEVPEVDVHLLDRSDLPSVGAGEAAQGPTAGAIANAVTAAVGVRVRDLPITVEAVTAAITAH
jgi:CO/xanthine dehydrogenase Mo-binding subunit